MQAANQAAQAGDDVTWPWVAVIASVCFTLCFIVYSIVHMDPPEDIRTDSHQMPGDGT